MKNRIPELDFLKCVCIILMVLFHLVYIEELYPETKRVVYSFHMPIFLIISGFFLDIRMDFPKFRRRLRRLLVPYLVMESAYTLAAALLPIREHIDGLTFTLFLDKMLLHPIGPYWFLHTLIAGQIVCFAASWISRCLRLTSLCPTFIVTGTLLFSAGAFLHIYSIENIFYLFLGILLRAAILSKGTSAHVGADLVSARPNTLVSARPTGSYLSFIPIVLIIANGGHREFGLQSIALTLLFATFFIAVYHSLEYSCNSSQLLATSCNSLKYIGKNTLPILLYSPLFTFPLKYLVPFLSFDPSGFLFGILAVTVVITGSLGLSVLINKILPNFTP